jgi:hypothetical protein
MQVTSTDVEDVPTDLTGEAAPVESVDRDVDSMSLTPEAVDNLDPELNAGVAEYGDSDPVPASEQPAPDCSCPHAHDRTAVSDCAQAHRGEVRKRPDVRAMRGRQGRPEMGTRDKQEAALLPHQDANSSQRQGGEQLLLACERVVWQRWHAELQDRYRLPQLQV